MYDFLNIICKDTMHPPSSYVNIACQHNMYDFKERFVKTQCFASLHNSEEDTSFLLFKPC